MKRSIIRERLGGSGQEPEKKREREEETVMSTLVYEKQQYLIIFI